MITQFFSNGKDVAKEQGQHFNITNKQKQFFELKKREKKILNQAVENIRKNITDFIN